MLTPDTYEAYALCICGLEASAHKLARSGFFVIESKGKGTHRCGGFYPRADWRAAEELTKKQRLEREAAAKAAKEERKAKRTPKRKASRKKAAPRAEQEYAPPFSALLGG